MPEAGMTYEGLFHKKILLVDDEKDIVELLEEMLCKEGFKNIITAANGQEAVRLCRKNQPDAVVLDIMLPDMDGIEVCKKIREFSLCPIMFLSSRNDDIDKILGLSSGGDDYVTKPFSPREVVFRIKAQLRRQQYHSSEKEVMKPQTLHVCDLEIDMEGSRAFKNGMELELTAKELGLLSYLAQNANRIISKERLYEQVWGEDGSGCDNTIMVHIRHIREKIEDDPANPKLLQTVKGLGYKLIKG